MCHSYLCIGDYDILPHPFFHSMDQNDNSCPEFWLIFSEDCVNLDIKDHITLKQELSKIPWFLFMYGRGNHMVDIYVVNPPY